MNKFLKDLGDFSNVEVNFGNPFKNLKKGKGVLAKNCEIKLDQEPARIPPQSPWLNLIMSSEPDYFEWNIIPPHIPALIELRSIINLLD